MRIAWLLLLASIVSATVPARKIDWEVFQLDGSGTVDVNLYYNLPPTTRTTGLVWIFHARGGEALGWLESVMMMDTLQVLVDLGYGIVAPDSAHRGLFSGAPFYPVWALPPYQDVAWSENGDVANIYRTIDFVTARGVFDPQTPVYAMGMSQGCDVMTLLGTVIDASAFACQSGSGYAVAQTIFRNSFADASVPTIFTLGTNATGGDGTNDDRPGLQTVSMDLLASRGVESVQYRFPVTRPVTPGEFLRIPGFTVEDGIEVLGILRASGCLDAQDWQYASPPWPGGCQDFGRFNTSRTDLDSVLRDTFGGNSIPENYPPYVVGFFKDHQARVGTPCAPLCP